MIGQDMDRMRSLLVNAFFFFFSLLKQLFPIRVCVCIGCEGNTGNENVSNGFSQSMLDTKTWLTEATATEAQ